MLGVTLSALAARRTQALTVLGLAVLAAAAAAAAPWYATARAESVGVADLAAAPVVQRLIEVNEPLPPNQARTLRPERLRTEVATALRTSAVDLRAFDGVSGANSAGYAPVGNQFGGDAIWLAYREDLCEQVVMVQGRCDLGPDTMVIGSRQAASQALRVGSTVKVVSSALARGGVTLRVAGIYRPLDPTRPYWADGELIGRSASSVRPVEASFTAYEAVVAFGPTTVELTYDLVARPEALRGDDLAALGGRIRQAGFDIQRGPQRLQSQLPALTERVRRDQDLVRLGVTGGAGLLLILCWFALFLSVQATAQDRRPDLGWLRLHGTTRWRTWELGYGQTALPLLVGGLLGAALGFAIARWYGGGVTEPAAARSAMIGAALAAAVAVIGALVAAVVAQWRLMRATVVDLHRRVPPRRRGWRSDVLDLAIVLLAGAAVYQLGVGDRAAGLALFAPALAALAVSLVLAWAVVPLAGRLATRALRAGRLGTALVGTDLARRPAVHRIFALVCVAVALLTSAVTEWDQDGQARQDRAEFELGAARVLTVGADSQAQLLAATRAADPGGRDAMAVVRYRGVLAVDTSRLAAVGLWRPQYGPPAGAVAGLLRPPIGTPVRVRGSGLAVTADVPADAILYALVQPTRTGDRVTVRFERPAGAGEDGAGGDGAGGAGGAGERGAAGRELVAAVPCASAGGCRLIGFSVDTVGAAQPAVTVRELRQTGPAAVLLDRVAFADRSRWRPTVGTDELGPTLMAAPVSGGPGAGGTKETGGLTIRLTNTPVQTVRVTGDVFLVDAPVPLPVLTAGELPTPELAGDTRLRLASQDVPAQPAARTRLLPLLGRAGSLVDLEYLDRLLPNADHDVMQVWLAADLTAEAGGDALVGRLRDGGLTVLSDETPDKVSARYANQGPALGLRFQLLVALLGALLAAGAVTVVAAVESPARAAELAALRGQGVRPRTVRAVALTGHVALVGVAVVAGVVAAVVADAVTRTAGTVFADGFNLLPVPDPGPLGLGLAIGVPVVFIGGAAAIAGVALTRAVRANGVRLR